MTTSAELEGAQEMPMYLIKFSYTPDTWARLLARPEDRREAVAPVFEAAGGKLHGLWYAFGEADGYALGELPDATAAASALVTIAASGALADVSTTVLLTAEEMLEALRRGGGISYRAPGAA
jgi:uncharacterized protein with GYD domain